MKKRGTSPREVERTVEKFIELLSAPVDTGKKRIRHFISPSYPDEEDEMYEDYNDDDPSPVEEEPDYYDTDEELYLIYRRTLLRHLN